MRRAAFAAPAEPEPLSALNITPLIDVLLVLLVMLILTIPIMAHKVPMDLPQPAPLPPAERVTHRLALTPAGTVTLDGAAVPDAALPARLAALRADPRTSLVFAADPAVRYERFVATLATVKRAGITRLGFENLSALRDRQ